jgi:hypothetical protein
MGWESRKNGGRYYTRSRRVGGRVVREYIGTGRVAEAIAYLEARDREERDRARAESSRMKRELEDTNRLVQAYYDQVEEQVREVLTAAGYHRPKRGKWRKRRDENR